MYYQGILAAKPSSQNLEEFLVAAGRKEQIGIKFHFCGDESAGQLRKDGADDRETADLFSLLSSGSRYLEGKCQ